MRSLRRIAIISLPVVAFIASCSTIASIFSDRPPKEDKVVSDFRAHRAVYEHLRTMISEDKDVHQVSSDGYQSNDSVEWKIAPGGGMPAKRFQEYLALLKEIGAIRVAREGGPGDVDISIEVWMSGFAGDTRHVWVCWLESQPSNASKSLEAFYKTDKPRTPTHVHIEGNWYIGADW